MSADGNGNGNGNGERLTPLQVLFIDHWFDTRFNGTEAAARAGYAGDRNALAQRASKLLRMGKVKAEVEKRFSAHGGTAEEVISHLLEIARHSDPTQFFKGGQLQHDQLEKNGRFVQSVHKMKDGWRIQCYSRLDALKELGRILQAGGIEEKGAEWGGDVNVYFKGELVEK
jgi:phage terminase small subunit